MKSLKRLLSLILVCLLVLSSVSALAVTEVPESQVIEDIFRFDVGDFVLGGEDSAVDPDIEKIEFLNSLGLWDDVEKDLDELLTMTEFLNIISKVRYGTDGVLTEQPEEGTGEEKVTYRDVLTYLIKMTGYYFRCENLGGTDASILAVAVEVGIISAYPDSIDSFVSRRVLAQLILNAVSVDLCELEIITNDSHRYTVMPDKNILNTVHDIWDISGFVNAVPGMSVYGGTDIDGEYIQIDRTNIHAGGMNLSMYYGAYVDAYAVFDETIDMYRIVYIKYSESYTPIEIDFADISGISSNTIRYLDAEGKNRQVSLGKIEVISENGNRLASISEMSDYETNEGKIVITSSTGKGSYDTAIIYKYNYYVVDAYRGIDKQFSLKFYAKHGENRYIQINDDDDDDDDDVLTNAVIDNKASVYSEIKPNSGIRLLECNYTGYNEIVASTKKIQGKVTLLYDDFVEIDGTEYRFSKDLLRNVRETAEDENIPYSEKVRLPQVGENATFYLFDDIVVGLTTTMDYTLGYLKTAFDTGSSLNPDLTLRVFTEDSEWLELPFADKVELDSEPRVAKKDVNAFLIENFHEGAKVGENLIRFKTNADGEIIALDTVYRGTDEFDTTDDIDYIGTYDTSVNWSKQVISDSNYLFSKKTNIFVVPENKEKEDKYRVVLPDVLVDGAVYKSMRWYNADDFQMLGTAIYNGDLSATTSQSELMTTFYVEKIGRAKVDEDDDDFGYKLSGKRFRMTRTWDKGSVEEATFYISEYNYNISKNLYGDLKVGDYIKISPIVEKIEGWEMILPGCDYSTLPDENVHMFYYDKNSITRLTGTIVKVDPEQALVLIDYGEGRKMTCGARVKAFVDLDEKTAREATIGDFRVGDRVYMLGAGLYGNFLIYAYGSGQ